VTRTEPIRAWRIWRVGNEGALESPIYGDEWPPGGAFRSECPDDHDRPLPECGCGVYAVATREQAVEWAEWARSALPYPIVLGQVQLWGRVLPYSRGYRAQHAYPYELELLDDDLALARALRGRYRVDVVGRAAA
jgi:hypothetical protein